VGLQYLTVRHYFIGCFRDFARYTRVLGLVKRAKVEGLAITGQIHFFPSIMCFSAHITSFECKYVSHGVWFDFIQSILSFPACD
jgi:hypothetical protein